MNDGFTITCNRCGSRNIDLHSLNFKHNGCDLKIKCCNCNHIEFIYIDEE